MSQCVQILHDKMQLQKEKIHFFEMTHALLFEKSVPKSYLGEAVLIVAYLFIWLPSKVLGNKALVNVLSEFFTDYHWFSKISPKVFICVSFVHIHAQSHGKLILELVNVSFIGYSPIKKGHKCYHPTSKKFFISINVNSAQNHPFFTYPHL